MFRGTPTVMDLPPFDAKKDDPLPVIALPTDDLKGNNELTTVCVCRYEHGLEITLRFKDEDRPNAFMNFLYDSIRRPLFGRSSDIETFFIVKTTNEVIFPGTYSGIDQKWDEKSPKHVVMTLNLDQFQRYNLVKAEGPIVVFVNTWNHLLAETNNNPDMTLLHFVPPSLPVDSSSKSVLAYDLRKGSREDVDNLFRGCLTSFSTVMTEKTAQKLGKRLD